MHQELSTCRRGSYIHVHVQAETCSKCAMHITFVFYLRLPHVILEEGIYMYMYLNEHTDDSVKVPSLAWTVPAK